MVTSLSKLFLLACFMLAPNIAAAYKVTTHEKFSQYAAENSILRNDPTLLIDFGLSTYGTPEFEDSDGKNKDVLGLIIFGSNFEDNGGDGFEILNPFITKRFFRHFFDTQGARGLTFLFEFESSPDWALEKTESGAPLNNPLQVYSYKDARDYFFNALTCQSSQCRQDNFSKTFQTIGHVIHHLQDMGQPQHSRLDTHPVAPKSFYEQYTATKDTQLAAMIDANRYPPPPTGANYFSQPRAYWQSGDGKGMAEFTGTNFVTIGTMFRKDRNAASGYSNNPKFPLPSGAGVILQPRSVTLTSISGVELIRNVDFLETTITDPLNGSVKPVKLATLSILDAHLNDNELGLDDEPLNVLTVNSQVFESRYPILLPRIAAFSTDFINYFFRGRVDMVENGSRSSWLILNRSSDAMSGTFSLYYDNSADVRTKLTQWSLSISPGGTSTPVEFTPPSDIVKNYVLVFAGTLGVETGTVTGKVLGINPVIPIPCGRPVNAGGGTEGYSQIHQLGTVAGRVELEFEAYSIPDAIKVTPDNDNNNKLEGSNGLVSGFKVYKFNYNPDRLGTTNVKVMVTGNSDSNTQWVFTLGGCPGQNLDNSDRAAKRVRVSFKYGLSTGVSSSVRCTADVSADGNRVGRVVGSGNTLYAELTQGEMHQVTYSNALCEGGTPLNRNGTYLSKNGRHCERSAAIS